MPLYPARNPVLVNVNDYNVWPTNAASVNDTNIANAIAALPSNGPGALVFPVVGTGQYTFTQSIVIDKDYITLLSWGATLAVDASADPSYLLIVGNTKNVQQCRIEGLTLQGKISPSSTGAGMHFRSSGGTIRKSRINQFGGHGLVIEAFSGGLVQVYLQDVWTAQNGYNAAHTSDGIYIGSSVSDSEFERVISYGDNAKSTTRNGFNNNGGNCKFVDSHAYLCSNDGIYNNGPHTQIIGGEWETNGSSGIENNATDAQVSTAHCYGNSWCDILSDAQAIVTNNRCESAAGAANIYLNTAGGVISGNICSGSSVAGIWLDSTALDATVADNIITSSGDTLRVAATHSTIHDNVLLAGTIVEKTGADNNTYHDNQILSGTAPTIVGTHSAFRNNAGYNPRGHSVTQPAVPATTVAQTNTTGCDCTVFVSGGTVSAIAIGGTTTGLTSGAFRVPVGQTITLTYTVAPSWQWYGD